MNKNLLLTLILLCLSVCVVKAQTSTTHVVQRGESMETVARKYGIGLEQLRSANPGVSGQPYVGKRLVVPVVQASESSAPSNPVTSDTSNGSYDHSYFMRRVQDAARYEEEGKYKSALRIYEDLQKNYDSAALHFLIGRCHYQRGKWKDAISELNIAVTRSDVSTSLRQDAQTLLNSAETNREEQLQRRGQLWAGIALATVATAGAIVTSKTSGKPATVPSYSSSGTGNLDYLLDPRFAIMQAQQQMAQQQMVQEQILKVSVDQAQLQYNQEMAMKEESWRCGYETAKQFRPNLTWDEWKMECMAAEAAAYNESYGSGSTAPTSTVATSSFSSSSSVTSSSSGRPCHLCRGIKKCWTCNGKRSYLSEMTGKYITCPNCTDGWCSHCHGSGKD